MYKKILAGALCGALAAGIILGHPPGSIAASEDTPVMEEVVEEAVDSLATTDGEWDDWSEDMDDDEDDGDTEEDDWGDEDPWGNDDEDDGDGDDDDFEWDDDYWDDEDWGDEDWGDDDDGDDDSDTPPLIEDPGEVSDELDSEERYSDASGTVGNITWVYSDRTISFSGSGPIPDYKLEELEARPWHIKDIDSVWIDPGITRVGNYAFYGKNVASIVWGESEQSIGRCAFRNTDLTQVVIPASVTNIEAGAFRGCESLTKVWFQEGLLSIGTRAFSNCEKLEDVTLPASLNSLAGNAFAGCKAVKTIGVAEGSQTYTCTDGAVYSKDGRTIVAMPCGKTGSYSVVEGTVIVSYGAFAESRLSSVTLPGTTKYIEKNAFEKSQLRHILFLNIDPVFGSNVFAGCKELLTLHAHNDTSVKRYAGLYDIRFEVYSDHEYVDVVVKKEPTCTEEGEGYEVCDECGYILDDSVPIDALGHRWDRGASIIDATCAHEGRIRYTCTRCGRIKLVRVAKKEHIWETDRRVDRKATCEREGQESIHCSVCNTVKEGTSISIPKTDHIWVYDEEESLEADCQEEGELFWYCKLCDEEKSKVDKIKPHKWITVKAVPATIYKAGSTAGKKCYWCGYAAKGSKKPKKISKLTPYIKVSRNSLTLSRKKSATITVKMANGDKVKSWKSSNTKIASVDKNGKVTAGSKTGTAKITVTLASKKKAVVTVTVKK